jgi:hypothetical protein
MPHLPWVAFVVEEDEASDPADVRLLGVNGVVLGAQGLAHTSTELSAGLIQQFLRSFVHLPVVDCEALLYNVSGAVDTYARSNWGLFYPIGRVRASAKMGN